MLTESKPREISVSITRIDGDLFQVVSKVIMEEKEDQKGRDKIASCLTSTDLNWALQMYQKEIIKAGFFPGSLIPVKNGYPFTK